MWLRVKSGYPIATGPITDMINAARPLTTGTSAPAPLVASRNGAAWSLRKSRFSVLLPLVSAIALLAMPGTGRTHTGDVESWVQHPAIHATVSLGLPVAHRATPGAPSHRRAAQPFGAPLASDAFVRPVLETTVSHAQPSADLSVGAQLVARGYDATAPPLA